LHVEREPVAQVAMSMVDVGESRGIATGKGNDWVKLFGKSNGGVIEAFGKAQETTGGPQASFPHLGIMAQHFNHFKGLSGGGSWSH
jgi:hypothetical protein